MILDSLNHSLRYNHHPTAVEISGSEIIHHIIVDKDQL